jgi:damage-control phosphatase, subfamily I
MRAAAECYPCFLNQAIKTARLAMDEPKRLKALLDEISVYLTSCPFTVPPPVLSEDVYGIISRRIGIADPYRELKRRCVRQALRLYPGLKNRIARSVDPLRTAVRAAIAGNVIDFGVEGKFDVSKDIPALIGQPLSIDHYRDFRRCLAGARRVLFLGDNAGETVFDRILIETLDRPVDYAVRSAPIINDALAEDAAASGLEPAASIVESGCRTPGLVLSRATPGFRRMFRAADMIISKGQGNYESLSETARPIFFLLKVKCEVVARRTGAALGSQVLISQRRVKQSF